MGLATLCTCVALTCWSGSGQQADGALRLEYPAAGVREERKINVDGFIETWQLKWASGPKSFCGARDLSMAITCPCTGFAYGETGDLLLLRLRDEIEVDRLHLTPFFTEGSGKAVLQRWPFFDNDLKGSLSRGLSGHCERTCCCPSDAFRRLRSRWTEPGILPSDRSASLWKEYRNCGWVVSS